MSSTPQDSDAALAARLSEVAGRIESVLAGLLADEPGPGEIARPPRLLAAMRHGALAGGKRLRPFLTVETARMLGRSGDGALRAGAAVELLHCYSLVHDDLPSMDDDDLRRGRPTVHRAFDEASAILAGDALLTLAFAVLGDPATHEDGGVRAALVVTLARAAGAGGMVGGQVLDLAAEGRFGGGGVLDAEAVRRLQAMKTGALLAASVEIGARLAGADAAALAALGRYGRRLGAAFQIADDILDVEASADEMGKATGKDDGRGKATLIGALGLDGARQERDRLAREAAEALSGFGAEAQMLRAAARFAANRRV